MITNENYVNSTMELTLHSDDWDSILRYA